MPRQLIAALLLAAPALGAQSPAQHATIDSLFGELALVTTADQMPAASRCTPYHGAMLHLCQGAVATKRADFSDDRDTAIEAEHELRQVVDDEPKWAAGWYALGMARLALARAGVTAKAGPLQVLGMSWESGAGHALVRSLELDSTNTDAATALALIPIPREGASQLRGRLAMLRRIRPLLGPAALAGAARVERVAGSRDSAAVLWQRTLDSGVLDSASVATELVRDLYASGRAEEGASVLLAHAATTTDAGQAAYRRELSWVAEPGELTTWDSLPPSERPGWLRQFWAGRDIAGGWPDGTRLVEHYRRIEAAWKDFTLSLPPSGRQMSSSTTGGIDTFQDLLLERRMMGNEGLAIEIVEGKAGNETPVTDARLLTGQFQAMGLGGPFRAFRTTQEVLDDRGIVWIRYGKPTQIVSSAGGEALQVWAYDNITPRLVLQFREENFDGQVGASRLVPTLIDVAGRFRDQFCGIECSLCSTHLWQDTSVDALASSRTENGRLNPGSVDHIVREGTAQIARATTTDANPRDFSAPVAPIVQLYGLTSGRRPVALAAFALPADQLEWTTPSAAAGRTVYSVRMVLSLLSADGTRIDVDTLRRFAVPAPLAKGQFLTGSLELPVAAGTYRGSLLLTQSDGRGAVATLPGIGVPSHNGSLDISSVVLGRQSSGIAWRSGSVLVPLNPLGAFTEKGEAALYYQVMGQQVGTSYRTTLEFFDTDSPDNSSLTLQFDEPAESAFREVQRTVGLANLKPGRYRLRVTVVGAGATASETARLVVVKR